MPMPCSCGVAKMDGIAMTIAQRDGATRGAHKLQRRHPILSSHGSRQWGSSAAKGDGSALREDGGRSGHGSVQWGRRRRPLIAAAATVGRGDVSPGGLYGCGLSMLRASHPPGWVEDYIEALPKAVRHQQIAACHHGRSWMKEGMARGRREGHFGLKR